MKKKQVLIIVGIIVILLVGVLVYVLSNKKEEKPTTIPHKEAEKVYSSIDVDENCTSMPQITSEQQVEKMNDEVLTYLIFNQMKKDGLLKDEISKDDYEESAKKVLNKKYIVEKIENYNFDGYVYTMTDNKITRKKTSCEGRKYVSKLFGYSTNDNKLELDVVAGYIEDKVLYDLEGKELGAYKKDKLNSLLDKGTMQVYTYTSKNGKYELYSIKKK